MTRFLSFFSSHIQYAHLLLSMPTVPRILEGCINASHNEPYFQWHKNVFLFVCLFYASNPNFLLKIVYSRVYDKAVLHH